MAELENSNPIEPAEAQMSASQYVDAIRKLKATTVSRDAYEKLMEENSKLVDGLLNNTSAPSEAEVTVDVEARQKRIDELREVLYAQKSSKNELDYMTKTLELRDLLIEAGEPDPFVPAGHRYTPTQEDIIAAERSAQCFKSCIDYANGDSRLFVQEVQRHIANDGGFGY